MFVTDTLIATPGPTEIPHRILLAMARRTTNPPDLDLEFFRRYDEARSMLTEILGAKKGNVIVWVGEAMSGLEAAVAT